MGVLLFQDLAVVPLLIMIPSLARPAEELAITLGWAALKAAFVLALLLIFGQKLMRYWFTVVAKRPGREGMLARRHAALVAEAIAAVQAKLNRVPKLREVWAGKFSQPDERTFVHKGGDPMKPNLNVEPLTFEEVHLATRSYK